MTVKLKQVESSWVLRKLVAFNRLQMARALPLEKLKESTKAATVVIQV